MHPGLCRINILEPLSTAVQVCNGFIPRERTAFGRRIGCDNPLGRLDRGQLLTKE
jgi:hypothetical protein